MKLLTVIVEDDAVEGAKSSRKLNLDMALLEEPIEVWASKFANEAFNDVKEFVATPADRQGEGRAD